MINIEYFACKVRRERDTRNEGVSEEVFFPPCGPQAPFPHTQAVPEAGDPELEPVS